MSKSKSQKSIKVLTININSRLVDNEVSVSIFRKEKVPLRHFLQTIENISPKNSFDVILIKVHQLQNHGWAFIENLRRTLLSLKNEDTVIFSFLESAGIKEYYLASLADEIILTPGGTLELIGFQAEAYFLKNSLDLVGVQADMIKTGDYKTFADMFTRDSMSEPHKKMIEAILDCYVDQVTQAIRLSRPKQGSLLDLFNQGPFTAKEAHDLNIVDHLLYEEEIDDYLKERYQVNKCVKMPLKPMPSSFSWKKLFKFSKKIALIYAEGTIVEGEKKGIRLSKNAITAKNIIKDIRKARDSKSIKALLLRINSPGGSANASDIIWHELKKTSEKKPVIVSMSNVAASGGYYLAMAADHVFAENMTLTGSIGVVLGKFHINELLDKLGIKREVVLKGERADMYSPAAPFTPDEKNKLENQVFSFYYKQFVGKAAESRNKDFDAMEKLAQGRVWTGVDAKNNDLIDENGGLLEALQETKNRAGIRDKDKVKYVIFPKKNIKFSLLSTIQDSFSPLSTNVLSILDLINNYENSPVLYHLSSFLKIK